MPFGVICDAVLETYRVEEVQESGQMSMRLMYPHSTVAMGSGQRANAWSVMNPTEWFSR